MIVSISLVLVCHSHLTEEGTKSERDQVTSTWKQSGGQRPKSEISGLRVIIEKKS